MKFFLAIKRPENIDDIPEWPMMTAQREEKRCTRS